MSVPKVQFYNIHRTIITHLLKHPTPDNHTVGYVDITDFETIDCFLIQPILQSRISQVASEAEEECLTIRAILQKSTQSELIELETKALESFREKISKIKLDKDLNLIVRKLIATLSLVINSTHKRTPTSNSLDVALKKLDLSHPDIASQLRIIFKTAEDQVNSLSSYGPDDRVKTLSEKWKSHYEEEAYKKILIYCKAAHLFENNGDPHEHALKLAILFGTAQGAFKALDTFALQTSGKEKGHEGESDKIIKRSEGTFVHDACSSFTLPQSLTYKNLDGTSFQIHWEKWKELMCKDISDLVFSISFSRADSIERFYAGIQIQSLEKTIESDEKSGLSLKEFYEQEVEEAPRSDSKYPALPFIRDQITSYREKNDSTALNQALKELTQCMMRSKRSFTDLDEDALLGLKQLEAEPLHDKIKFKLKVIKETQNDAQKLMKLEISANFLLKAYVLAIKKQNKPFNELDKLTIVGIAKIQNESLNPILQYLSKMGISDASIIEFENLDRKEAGIHIPDIMCRLPQYPRLYLRKLDVRTNEENAAKGACLGKIISPNCCQSMGDAGNDCAVNGLTSPNGGFYILCEGDPDSPTHDDPIVAQSWVWRGANDEFCFDSVEYNQVKIAKRQIISDFIYAATLELIKNEGGITKIFIGQNGMTPSHIGIELDLPSATVKDYNGYRDSYSQRVLHHDLAPYLLLIPQTVNTLNSNPVYKIIREQSTLRLKAELDKAENLNSSPFMQILVQYIMTSPHYLEDKSTILNNFENLFTFGELSPAQIAKFLNFIKMNDQYIHIINGFNWPKHISILLYLIKKGAVLHLKNNEAHTILDVLSTDENLFPQFIESLLPDALLKLISTSSFLTRCPLQMILFILGKLPEERRLEALSTSEDSLGCNILFSCKIDDMVSILNVLPIIDRLKPIIISNQSGASALRSIHDLKSLQNILSCLSIEDQHTLLYLQGKSGQSLVCFVEENVKSIQDLFNLYPKSEYLRLLQINNKYEKNLLQRFSHNLECLKAILDLYPNNEERVNALRKPNYLGRMALHYAVTNLHALNFLIDNYFKEDALSILKAKDRFGQSLISESLESPDTFKFLRTLYTDDEFTDIIKEKNSANFSILSYAAHNPPLFESIFKFVQDKETAVQEKSTDWSLFTNSFMFSDTIKIILPYYPKHKLLVAFKACLAIYENCDNISPKCNASILAILIALPKEDIEESHHLIKAMYEEVKQPLPETINALMKRQNEESVASKTLGFSEALTKPHSGGLPRLDTNLAESKPNSLRMP